MILAAGLTPAWQQIISIDSLRVGEVHRASEVLWCASGKVLNAGIAAHHLGGPVRTLAPRGGPSGLQMAQDLEALGLSSRWTSMAGATRICTTILERDAGRTTELVENAPPLAPDEIEMFVRAFEEEADRADVVVLSGSLSPGAASTFYRDLLRRTRARVILDARGPELLEALPEGPFIAKPNQDELARTLGRELASTEDLREAMLETRRLGAEWVVVSRGTSPLLACGPDTFHSFVPPRVSAVNVIACGDCLAGALAWGLSHGLDVPAAIRVGMGAAAQNAGVVLPGRVDPTMVESLAGKVRQDERLPR